MVTVVLSATHARPTLPTQFPEPELSEDSGKYEDHETVVYHGGVMTHHSLVIWTP